MPVSPARQVAYRVLRRIEAGRGFAVDLLRGREASALESVDRRLATELVMGVLRWAGELDFEIELLSGRQLPSLDSEVVTILRMGVYQIRFLRKVPKSAAVNEAVELTKAARKRSAAGFVNAVLRRCEGAVGRTAERQAEPADAAGAEAARRLVPGWLFERWVSRVGEAAATSLAWQSVQTPPVALRVAAPGLDRETVQSELAAEGVRTRAGKFGCFALVVESGSAASARAVREGRVVIQDEASQLIPQLLRVEPGNSVLDVCAAPGIKTRQIAAALGRGSIAACDRSARRLRTLKQLLGDRLAEGVRLGIVRLDATRPLPFQSKFDRILVDVPCSGTGTLARNPEIKWRLRPADLPRLAAMEQTMLTNALALLAPGGRLVYVTCSLEPEENEQVVEKVMERVSAFRLLTGPELGAKFPALAVLFDSRGYFRTRPDVHGLDGFFAAVIVPSP